MGTGEPVEGGVLTTWVDAEGVAMLERNSDADAGSAKWVAEMDEAWVAELDEAWSGFEAVAVSAVGVDPEMVDSLILSIAPPVPLGWTDTTADPVVPAPSLSTCPSTAIIQYR